MRRRIVIERAERLNQVPPRSTRESDRYKKRLKARGIDPIDLTVGTVDASPDSHTIDELTQALSEMSEPNHDSEAALTSFRKAFAKWFSKRFDVDLDPDTQVLPLAGSKTGVACAALSLVNPGETVLIPDPAYPAYRSAAIMAGGNVRTIPLAERNDFLPDLRQVDPVVAQQAKLMFVSYPNNPTGAVADIQVFRGIIDFARQNNIIVCHDATHALMTYGEYDAPSLLQAPGALNVSFEIFSLSTILGGAPWDLGVAVGNAASLAGLSQLTDNLDTALFPAIQRVAVDALRDSDRILSDLMPVFERRRDLLVDGLQSLGWKVRAPSAGMYLWIPTPPRYTSVRFGVLLRKAGVFVVPGAFMGEYGEGYVRIALNASEEDLKIVLERIEQSLSRRHRKRLQYANLSLA